MSEQNTLQNASQSAAAAPTGGGYSDSRAAFSLRVKEFREAMGLLYIRNNASGRNKFRHKWPEVALFLFGEELIQMDNEGTQDRGRRAELEDKAGLRRIALKALLEEYEDKSVNSGVLNFEYIGSILDKLGLELGKLFYAEDIIARVRPSLVHKTVAVEVAQQPQLQPMQMSPEVLVEQLSAPVTSASYMTAEEAAERDLAEQERLALRTMPPPPPQPLSLDQLQQEVRQSDQFSHMKIEISDEIRPIEVEAQPEAAFIQQDQIFPQEIPVENIVHQEMVAAPVSMPVSEQVLQQEVVMIQQESILQYQESVTQVVTDPVVSPQYQPVYEQAPIEQAPVVQEMTVPVYQEPVTLQEPVMTPIIEPTFVGAEPQQVTTEPSPQAVPFSLPPDSEKKPRIEIAGLRIKDDQQQPSQVSDAGTQGH